MSKRILYKNEFGYTSFNVNYSDIHIEIGSFFCVFDAVSFYYFFKKFKKKNINYIKTAIVTPSGKKVFISVTDDILLSLTIEQFKTTHATLKKLNQLIKKPNWILSAKIKKNMCHTREILHQNDIGYISICKGCENIHIEIGNFMTVLCKKGFSMMIKDLSRVDKKIKKHTFSTHSGKKLLIRITDNSFITQTIDEFEKTLIMFEMANHYLKAIEILNPKTLWKNQF